MLYRLCIIDLYLHIICNHRKIIYLDNIYIYNVKKMEFLFIFIDFLFSTIRKLLFFLCIYYSMHIVQ